MTPETTASPDRDGANGVSRTPQGLNPLELTGKYFTTPDNREGRIVDFCEGNLLGEKTWLFLAGFYCRQRDFTYTKVLRSSDLLNFTFYDQRPGEIEGGGELW